MATVIIQARMGSTRLPGKVAASILDQPMLAWVVRRVMRARRVAAVTVATTDQALDDDVAALAGQLGCDVVRGSEDDVLSRYVLAVRASDDDVFVRVTSDCPLIDPDLIDAVIGALADADYASNVLEPRTYPRGLDVEAFTRDALLAADERDTDPASREHVTPYLHRHPEMFRLARVAGDEDHSGHRWTVDTPQDLALVRRIAESFGHDRFGWREALAVVEAHPAWRELNAGIEQKPIS